jgi:5-methyltetrahydropteroyltriglutamate--homocysteine methyltransferase
MNRGNRKILTTHTGSLPRPAALLPLLFANEAGTVDPEALERAVQAAVVDVVRQQADAGIDVINDGEMGKISYASYVKDRLTGFEGQGSLPTLGDIVEFPSFGQRAYAGAQESLKHRRLAACDGPIRAKGGSQVARDIENLRSATRGVSTAGVFMSAASPGVIALFFSNYYYPSREEYLSAIAEAMQPEYEAIANAGIVLQLDCPDLAMGRHIQFKDASLDEFRAQARLNVEVLNYATRKIPPNQMRMHICWGNYEGPHHLDVPLADVIDIVFAARPNGISIEACNPRHEHEWKLFENVGLPVGKLLIPGVIDSTTNYIEHPDLVAERILRYAHVVGPENIIAGSDCGFSTGAGTTTVDPAIAWAKLRSLVEGAGRATRELSAAP